jgi:sugar (pentulose or hexulose) kinase
MPVVLGIDLGTTTVTALALDTDSGAVRSRTRENPPPRQSAPGYSEWEPGALLVQAFNCLEDLARDLEQKPVALGITGQQHGVVLVDRSFQPRTPFFGWQDRRGLETFPGASHSYVDEARARLGSDAPARTGCRISAGYLALTLFWLRRQGPMPRELRACFLPDYFAALLTEKYPVTDPTLAGSSGVLNVPAGEWDADCLQALELPRELFPPVKPSGSLLGPLRPQPSHSARLPTNIPVFVGIGDNQASFLGSVGRRPDTVLVNVGTGGQVSLFTETYRHDPQLETRPFPGGGFLLVSAGLCGGRSYALLEGFCRQIARELFDVQEPAAAYERLNTLAQGIAPGADGLRCEPLFTGTRAQPELRASWTGLSPENFTPGHLARALLEGMARTFRDSFELLVRQTGLRPARLVGSGNGIRENPLLARLIGEAFGLPLEVPVHREEAAFGAALLAAVGVGIFPDLAAAGGLLRTAAVGQG